MANLKDFKAILHNQLLERAPDEEIEATVGTIDLLARQEERERIISLLADSSPALTWDGKVVTRAEIRAALDPNLVATRG